MTTVAIELPDDLAQKASAAGLLAPDAIADLLREQLRRRALEHLRERSARMPFDELTPEIEQEIVAEVKAYRAERRSRQG
ncbi:MAG: hypothetical protein IPK27_23240 [Rhodanobacteraceae bacterium]|nr:hypothetical protein [Rhodanobacteraceae bacterium]